MWLWSFVLSGSLAAESVDDDVLELEVTVRAEPAVSGPSLTMDEVRSVPGALGDPLRALQGQPGIGRSPYGVAVLLVRGLGPSHQAAWLGDVRLPRALHFGGLGSIVDIGLLESVSVDHAPGSARHGGSLGSAVVLQPDTTRYAHPGGEMSIDALQARAMGRQTLPFDTELAVALRRSWLDLVLQPVLNDLGALTRLPWSQDGAIRLQHHTPHGDVWQVTVLGASDKLVTTDGGDEESDSYGAWLVRGLAQTIHEVGRWTLRSGWSVGPEARTAQAIIADIPVAGLPLPTGRQEVSERRVEARGRGVAVHEGRIGTGELGVDTEVGHLRFYSGGGIGDAEFDRISTRSAGAWTEWSAGLGPLTSVVGGRVDTFGADAWSATTADPRIRLELRTGERSRLVGSAGTAHQAPYPRMVSDDVGIPDLLPERAVHASVTAEQGVGSSKLQLTWFGSRLDQLVIGRDGSYRFDDPVLPGPRDTGDWRNEGEGRVVGVESSLTVRDGRTSLELSGSLVRSERRDEDGEWQPWTFDQPWSAAAVVTRELGRHFDVGSRVRAGAGLPYTPVVNAAIHAENGSALPVFGAYQTARLQTFFAADLRTEWHTELRRGGEVGVYLEVQNVAPQRNEEIVAWSTDWRDVTPVMGLPVLPTLGLRGSL